jgi:hypothetical protein
MNVMAPLVEKLGGFKDISGVLRRRVSTKVENLERLGMCCLYSLIEIDK